MKVTLTDYNKDAVEKLIFSKSTRLEMNPYLLEDIQAWPQEAKMKELEYISNTIKSSWEFLDYTFMIEGVTRAFTHQFVRNRQGSYAQQTMRMLDKADFTYLTGPSFKDAGEKAVHLYDAVMSLINMTYKDLIDLGVKVEDARGILPTNIHTNIMVKYNLRTLSELVASRSSPRTQGEFRDVMEGMYQEVIAVHPWAKMFLHSKKVEAAKELDQFIEDTAGSEDRLRIIKLVDILRK